jgi:hypothetical protein
MSLGYAAAQTAYVSDDRDSLDNVGDIETELSEVVVPLATVLAHSLEDTVNIPGDTTVQITIGPDTSGEQVAFEFQCTFGRGICEPFFEACDRLNLTCTD